MTSSDVISYCWNLKFSYFVNLNLGYQPAKFQVSRLSGSNYTEVGIRHKKHNYDIIITLLFNIRFSKLHIL